MFVGPDAKLGTKAAHSDCPSITKKGRQRLVGSTTRILKKSTLDKNQLNYPPVSHNYGHASYGHTPKKVEVLHIFGSF